MVKRMMFATLLLLAGGASALADPGQRWNITEVAADGAQGQWYVTIDANNKVTGTTNMQMDTGAMLSYTLAGTADKSSYNITLADRSDGKKNCVFVGNSYLNTDNVSHKILGEVHCDGEEKFFIRGGW
jgi:hypothetical protein